MFLSGVCKPSEGKLGGGGGSSSPQQGTHPPQQDEKARLCRRKLTVTRFDPLPRKETTKKTTRQWPRSGRVSSTPGLLIRTEGGPRDGLSSPLTDAGVCAQNFSPPTEGGCYFSTDSVVVMIAPLSLTLSCTIHCVNTNM